MGIFVLIIFAAKVSGSHYNPAITVAFMLRKDIGGFSRPLGVAYIIAQVLGGFVASIIAAIFRAEATTFGIDSAKYIFPGMASETIGAFFVCFLYLTQTAKKTKISEDPAITTLIIASAYLASMLLVSGPDDYLSPLNPAVSLGIMFQQAFNKVGKGFAYIYVYLPFPLLGGLCAVLFYEKVYKRVQDTIEESEGLDGAHGHGEGGVLD